jgi:N-acetylneuraminic acid mutarotase
MDKKFLLTKLMPFLLPLIFLTNCRPSPDQPAARYGAKMIFDPVGERSIIFGGRAEGLFGLKYFNDLWAFNYPDQTWTKVKASNRPTARLSPGMVYDPDHHQIILFGGDSTQGRLGDTWVFDLAKNRWQEVTPANSPPSRSDMGMVFDDTNHLVILFSGYCKEGSRDLCNDTWTYDPKSTTWNEMGPKTFPPIMYGHSFVYDPSIRQSILWGGHMSAYQGGSFSSIGYGDTIWSYDYRENLWREKGTNDPRSPSARYWHQSSYDTTSGSMILFGGMGGQGLLADTWLYHGTDGNWEKVNPGESPSPRFNAAITYDSSNEVILLFGGYGEGAVDLQDTWVFKETETGWQWRNILQ